MRGDLHIRRASQDDLEAILMLILQDTLAQEREAPLQEGILEPCYREAFHKIDTDKNQYLMVAEHEKEVVGTCHLTLIPSLTFKGSTRLQIEAVRVSEKHRGKKVGARMIEAALEYAKIHGVFLVQLTTDKQRTKAIKFYEKQGFKATHDGMKLYLY
ncbi:MAG: GNAT family N-acetyltransferase [Alphaproteobacteria bacterium]|nr:GNAT family N-acetyltransferase [Alphaproteobacteria bacterium]NCQ67003.1 GNAT family N-acetyltransferase [Alphaproteobacteria bacterium]NCT07600.1 GNAT family N-acetyltransferase [Alphaproteobacteria bacterium]